MTLFRLPATASVTVLRPTGHASRRQAQILSLVAGGYSDKEIARELGISHRTVRTHLEKFFQRHGQRNRSGADAVWLANRTA